MSEVAIQRMICRAVVSERYRDRLLGSDREKILRASDLEDREREAFLAISAETIEEFAAGVERAMRNWKRRAKQNRSPESLPIRNLISIDIRRRGE
jgi:hypothetical protein